LEALARLRGEVIAQCQLALVWRASPRQHALSRIRQICRIIPFTTKTADDVGRLLARSGTSDVVNAAVIAAAIENNAAVLTSDLKDLATLAGAAGYPGPPAPGLSAPAAG
jgi:predicted nucleic acid-binding protein